MTHQPVILTTPNPSYTTRRPQRRGTAAQSFDLER